MCRSMWQYTETGTFNIEWWIYHTCVFYFLGVENSIPNPLSRLSFYQKYYQILLHGKFPIKERKLCLVGPPDSGKSCWFAPFEGRFLWNHYWTIWLFWALPPSGLKSKFFVNSNPCLLWIVSGIIPTKYIAGVVTDGKFSGSQIDAKTQVVQMEEWTANSLSCEDAKRILQGKNHFLFFYISNFG